MGTHITHVKQAATFIHGLSETGHRQTGNEYQRITLLELVTDLLVGKANGAARAWAMLRPVALRQLWGKGLDHKQGPHNDNTNRGKHCQAEAYGCKSTTERSKWLIISNFPE
eukprot:scaffold404546_cov45-Prasinocladus_malaysianus.AAC.2